MYIQRIFFVLRYTLIDCAYLPGEHQGGIIWNNIICV